jgi:large subunit ribosomal protein L3
MNHHPGIVGWKIGMTQVFREDGTVVICTVVRAGCTIVAKRTMEKDGYSAIVLGLGERKEKHTTKPMAGSFKKAGVSPKRVLKELRCSPEYAAGLEVGQVLKVEDAFELGQIVDVQGRTRGRGFQGVMRRHNFAGAVASHGAHENMRHAGSVGMNMTPGRTLKGHRMAGHYGDEQVTTHNLKVAQLMPEEQLVLVEGSIPGARNALVTVRGANKKKNAGRPKKEG